MQLDRYSPSPIATFIVFRANLVFEKPVTASRSSSPSASVQLWHCAASEETPGENEHWCEQVMPATERSEADRFRRHTTRNQHVIGRGMARFLLCHHASTSNQTSPDEICFSLGPHGKPAVATPVHLDQPFNVAHTSGMVLCAVANQGVEKLGVDVESVRRRTSLELAERYFAEPEVRFLSKQDATKAPLVFLRIWTLKEAFVKAMGTGLQTQLDQFAFVDILSARPQIEFLNPALGDASDWRFECLQPRDGFLAAVAIETNRHAKPHADWQLQANPFETLMQGRSRDS